MRTRFLSLFALLSLSLSLVVIGCTSSQPKDEGAACGGETACGGDAGGDKLEERFAKNWDVAKTLKGDAEAGRKFFYEKTYGNLMTCASCHSMNEGDTMSADAGDHQRAAVSVFGARWRTNIKNTGSHNATLGGDVCVPFWMNGPEEGAAPQDLANLDAFLKAESGDKDHATAVNIDWKARSYTIPETLTGGDAVRGKEMALRYCGTCHEVDGVAPLVDVDERDLHGGSIPAERLSRVAKRIKDSGRKNNDFMPGFSDQRMAKQDLLDLLAWFEKK
ncbi:MAG: c-type cytochrome [Planctomycetes bacterium]|nr:c-type cytochrome [Planctomycetota bacterium]